MTRDRVYSKPRPQIVDFAFDETVADVFPDMIRRSVPGYELVVPMTGLLAARALRGRTNPLVYDLGCSLGATTLAVLRALDALAIEAEGLEVRAVDSAAAMLERAAASIHDPRVRFVEADVCALEFEPCQIVIMNWLLQFLPPEVRGDLLGRIRRRLSPDGWLLLAEKITSDEETTEQFNQAAHEDFKRANGYSDLEISQKRTALERVMVTDTLDTHRSRLQTAGFSRIEVWFRCLNWIAIAARP